MIGEQNQGVALLHHLRRVIFFLDHQLVRTGQLLQGRDRKPLVFLQLASHYQTLAPHGGQGRAAVLPFCGQNFDGDAPRVFPQHISHRIDKGGFSVSARAVSHDNPLLEYLSHGSHAGNHLEVVPDTLVAAGYPIQELAPHGFPCCSRGIGGNPGTIGFGIMWPDPAAAQVHNSRRGVQIKGIGVQLVRLYHEGRNRQGNQAVDSGSVSGRRGVFEIGFCSRFRVFGLAPVAFTDSLAGKVDIRLGGGMLGRRVAGQGVLIHSPGQLQGTASSMMVASIPFLPIPPQPAQRIRIEQILGVNAGENRRVSRVGIIGRFNILRGRPCRNGRKRPPCPLVLIGGIIFRRRPLAVGYSLLRRPTEVVIPLQLLQVLVILLGSVRRC